MQIKILLFVLHKNSLFKTRVRLVENLCLRTKHKFHDFSTRKPRGFTCQCLLGYIFFFKVISKGGVEDTMLEAKDTKKSETKAKDGSSKAKDSSSKDSPSRGQGQECLRPRTLRGSDLKKQTRFSL